MIEDQVLFHLTKFGKIILSLLTFPDPLKGRDEAVPQGLRSASLNPVATHTRVDCRMCYAFVVYLIECKKTRV